ncbi:DNA polymerase IV 2 [Portibacter lacus]|uniref:DNA polymerase IV n=2 Tax=Portibacter lacus TaxID=1099794 RepID=A0AA37SN21_9BACT|nr:DNA polymerase IV 2 [Portibacter lacus]
MDAFFAAVEQRDDPSLRGKPMAVGGHDKVRGVIATASYEARRFRVSSAMSTRIAKKKCPRLIVVPPRFKVYKQISQQIRDIFYEYTDLVEPLSLDEAYLDVTENKKGIESAIQIAKDIKAIIKAETQLTASAGISYNKFLAKVASDYHKPDGLTAILPENAQRFLDNLDINTFHGVGKATAKKMERMKISKGADLKQYTRSELGMHFGKMGTQFYDIVRGIDDRPVDPDRKRKSVSVENTFREDISDRHDMIQELKSLSVKVAETLQKMEIKGRTVNIKVRLADFTTFSKSKTFKEFSNDGALLETTAVELFEQLEQEIPSVRLLGVGMSNLDNQDDPKSKQMDLGF